MPATSGSVLSGRRPSQQTAHLCLTWATLLLLRADDAREIRGDGSDLGGHRCKAGGGDRCGAGTNVAMVVVGQAHDEVGEVADSIQTHWAEATPLRPGPDPPLAPPSSNRRAPHLGSLWQGTTATHGSGLLLDDLDDGLDTIRCPSCAWSLTCPRPAGWRAGPDSNKRPGSAAITWASKSTRSGFEVAEVHGHDRAARDAADNACLRLVIRCPLL